MERKGKDLVKGDIGVIVEMLNKALSDELFSTHQYWLGAKLVRGAMRGQAIEELKEHSEEEFKHANMLADRILQLGGVPVLKPEDWYKLSNCGYEAPEDPEVTTILKQNIEGEQCAINVYKKLSDFLKGKDDITYYMVMEILEDEIEHEDELMTLLEDITE
jgi:bacterioferritin